MVISQSTTIEFLYGDSAIWAGLVSWLDSGMVPVLKSSRSKVRGRSVMGIVKSEIVSRESSQELGFMTKAEIMGLSAAIKQIRKTQYGQLIYERYPKLHPTRAADWYGSVNYDMSLSIIDAKLHNGEYETFDQIAKDLDLMCNNAKTHNPDTSPEWPEIKAVDTTRQKVLGKLSSMERRERISTTAAKIESTHEKLATARNALDLCSLVALAEKEEFTALEDKGIENLIESPFFIEMLSSFPAIHQLHSFATPGPKLRLFIARFVAGQLLNPGDAATKKVVQDALTNNKVLSAEYFAVIDGKNGIQILAEDGSKCDYHQHDADQPCPYSAEQVLYDSDVEPLILEEIG